MTDIAERVHAGYGPCDDFAKDACLECLKRLPAIVEELAEMRWLFQKRREREAEYIAEWQTATGDTDRLPDYGALLAWMRARAVRAEAA